MTDFDLLTPLEASASALSHAQRVAEAASIEGRQVGQALHAVAEAESVHRTNAEAVLKERAERNQPFAMSHRAFARDYKASPRLRTAVNVALSLGRPLLLTGEPGSGKTLAAHWLAHIMGLEPVHEFHVKSESRARDLLYTFDAVSWFRQAQLNTTETPVEKEPFLVPQALGRAFGWEEATKRPSVVLIDEIDKAPRDFPNDLLLELDQMRFKIEETDRWVACPPDMRPIVVITSNAERQLPPPFLRRCIVHHIRLDADTVAAILTARLADFELRDYELVESATNFWAKLVRFEGLQRKPTLDEYWRWLALATSHGGMPVRSLARALNTNSGTELPFVGSLFSESDYRIVFPNDATREAGEA